MRTIIANKTCQRHENEAFARRTAAAQKADDD